MPDNAQTAGLYGGIDIGGTKIMAVIADAQGGLIGASKKKTRPDKGFVEVCRRAAAALQEAADEAGVDMAGLEAVGVGAPSPVAVDGTAIMAVNMGWKMEPLAPTLAEMTGRPVFAENDCNVGAYGEYVYGAAQGARTVVGLFMGTGLGGGIVFRGELVTGENHQAAELGHIILKEGGRQCGCGKNGCLEAYASKSGMGRRLAWEIHHQGRKSWLREACPDGRYGSIKSSVLREAYVKGDALAVETLHEAAYFLGLGVAAYVTVLGPDVVVLGGGVMEALGKELLPMVLRTAKKNTYPESTFRDAKIKLARLGDHAVALGAVAYARDRLSGKINV